MDKQARYAQHIRDRYPELRIERARLSGEGQNNDVLIVNEELVFRFPKHAAGMRQLATETAILRAIRGRVTLDIPNPIYRGLEPRVVGAVFTGYRMIAGEPLRRDTPAVLGDQAAFGRVAAQLAAFLRALHGVPAGDIPGPPLSLADGREAWAALYAGIRERLFPRMRPDARAWAREHFETFLGDPGNFDYAPTLRHGDFGPGNILFDARARAVSGVIDFGGAGLGDPAVDFAGLLASYGERFLARCSSLYPEIASALDRARFYAGTFALQEALFGAEHGDREAFASGIAPYS